MSYRSNAAEAWDPDPQSTAAPPEIPLDLLPPPSLTQPLWRSLAGNLRDTLAPEKLPPLELTSRPVYVGLPLGERLRLPWFRTVFTNIGDVSRRKRCLRWNLNRGRSMSVNSSPINSAISGGARCCGIWPIALRQKHCRL